MRAVLWMAAVALAALRGASQAAVQVEAKAGGLDQVIGLLQSMLQKFAAQFAEDRQTWDQHLALSNEQENDKQAFIAEQKSVVAQATSLLNAKRGELAQLTESIASLQKEQAQTETSLRELSEMRAQEHQQHEAELADLIKAIAAVNKALEVLAGHYAAGPPPELLQQIRHVVQMGLTALQVRTPEQKVQLPSGAAAFLQGKQGPDWLSTDGSQYEEYSAQGGGHAILGMLTKMRSQLEESKTQAIARENEARRQYEETRTAKEAELTRTKAELTAKGNQKVECEATIESTTAVLDQAGADISEAEAFLKQLLADRATFQAEFDERTRMRQNERAATQAALDALQSVSTGNTAMFLQVASRTNARDALAAAGVDLASPQLAPLRVALAQKQDGFMAQQQQQRFAPEAMQPVKDLLHELIRRLEAELSEESSQHDWCETEKSTAAASQAEREGRIHELQQRVDMTTTSISTLKSEILFLEEEITRIAKETEEAIAVRKAENEQFVTAKADHDEVIGALERAITALSAQYSFMQGSSPFGAYEGGDGSSVLALLQDLLHRYAEARAELVANEQAAEAAHGKLLEENESFRLDTTALKNAKTATRRENLGLLGTGKQELKVNMVELQQVNKYLQDLRPSCDDIRSTFEERKKRREAEIAALKEALEVISDPTSV